MEQISGYSLVIAKASVTQMTTKPLFGKSHVKFGQCFTLWCYFFQVGGILAAKYAHRLDAFGTAFMGARGEPGAVEKYCSSYGAHLMSHFPLDTMTFSDYVISQFMRRVNCTDDPTTYLIQHGTDKIQPGECVTLARDYSVDGAALGAMHPEIIRNMFARTHTEVSNRHWQDARRAGVDIPERQDKMSYEEAEEGEDQSFMEYCRTCCPTIYATLRS